MGWSIKLLEAVVAPGIGSFTSAAIPDLQARFPQAEHWIVNHFFDSALRGQFGDRLRQVALGIVRRATHAFNAFHAARTLTLEYLDGVVPASPRIRKYYAALDAWETCILQVCMALELYRWWNGGVGAFVKNDATPEFRVWTIGNQIKHTSKCVDSGQCGPAELVPLWLTNSGLRSFAGLELTYDEMAKLIADVAELANEVQDPAGWVERRRREGALG